MINNNVLPGPLPKIHIKVSPLNNLYYICPNIIHTKKKKTSKKKNKQKKTNKKQQNPPKKPKQNKQTNTNK